MSCGPCQSKGWPNKERGRICCLNWARGLELEDFYRNKVRVYSEAELFDLYNRFEIQRVEHSKKKLQAMGGNVPDMEPDDYCDWLIRRGICPHAIVTDNSRYHFENSVLLDSEMGLKLPDPKLSLGETPSLFFHALNIVRSARSKVREEEKEKNG